MSKKDITPPENDEIIEREVGERVDFMAHFEPETVKDLGDGVFEATITTSAVDRTGESIATTGISSANYMNNPVVLYGHDYEGLPIGKTLKLTHFQNKIKARFQLAIAEYPFAATVASLIKGGYLNATSIGGLVKQWSDDYKTIEEMEMVEFSVVPVPANQEALMTARSLKEVTGKDIATIRAEYQDFAQKIFVDKLAGMPHDKVNDAIGTLKYLVARLEESVYEPSNHDEKTKTVKRYVIRDANAVVAQAHKTVKILKLSPTE